MKREKILATLFNIFEIISGFGVTLILFFCIYGLFDIISSGSSCDNFENYIPLVQLIYWLIPGPFIFWAGISGFFKRLNQKLSNYILIAVFITVFGIKAIYHFLWLVYFIFADRGILLKILFDLVMTLFYSFIFTIIPYIQIKKGRLKL